MEYKQYCEGLEVEIASLIRVEEVVSKKGKEISKNGGWGKHPKR